jgi:uncharacterized protein YecE (DUF72 family)
LTQYLIGTGGWAYFDVPSKPRLKAYSEVFDFVEVNYTFYEYPDTRMVERWRQIVQDKFTFTVRCNQDLTHKIGLRPVDEAYAVFSRMISFCIILDAPFLHLETPAGYVFDEEKVEEARSFFSTVDLKDVRLAWEIRSPISKKLVELMQEFDIVHSVDLSNEDPAYRSDVVYTRLFGKGKRNIYQFTDEELVEVDQNILQHQAKKAIAAFHGLRMNTDAVRFKSYNKTRRFPAVTSSTGVDSARVVLSEDARFPSTKEQLIEHQGWKVIDLTSDRRIRLSDWLSKLPEKTYDNLEEVVQGLEACT